MASEARNARSFVMDTLIGTGIFAAKRFAARWIRTAWPSGYSIGELNEDELSRRAATISRTQNTWLVSGRAEWGPRALGNRSIVADPRRPE